MKFKVSLACTLVQIYFPLDVRTYVCVCVNHFSESSSNVVANYIEGFLEMTDVCFSTDFSENGFKKHLDS